MMPGQISKSRYGCRFAPKHEGTFLCCLVPAPPAHMVTAEQTAADVMAEALPA